jgi:hypothetical protein
MLPAVVVCQVPLGDKLVTPVPLVTRDAADSPLLLAMPIR